MAHCRLSSFLSLQYLFLLSSALPSAVFLNNNSTTLTWSATGTHHILETDASNPSFACGFYREAGSFYFYVFISPNNSTGNYQTVWTANRERPLQENSFLTLSQDRGLQLVDINGTVMWSTETEIIGTVYGMRLLDTGNLVVLGINNDTLWQSFDHPTDTLVANQTLKNAQNLTSSSSASNFSQVSYYVVMKNDNLSFFIKANPPQMYAQLNNFAKGPQRTCVPRNGNRSTELNLTGSGTPRSCNTENSLFITYSTTSLSVRPQSYSIKIGSPSHFMRMESDGRLKLYAWSYEQSQWTASELSLNKDSDECLYPLPCGEFGVCKNGNCSCPKSINGSSHYFENVSVAELPSKGCKGIEPLPPCNDVDNVKMEELENYSYFNYIDENAAASEFRHLNRCKNACLNSCHCKAIFFKSERNDALGNCYMLNQVFSIREDPLPSQIYVSWAFVKVAGHTNPPTLTTPSGEQAPDTARVKTILIIIVCLVCALLISGAIVILLVMSKIRKEATEENEEEEEFDTLQDGMMPIRRFSYEELQRFTENFSRLLGKGGFGSVFLGELTDGIQIAVKRLESSRQGSKEFVAEVQTIGNINHLNLVRLIGFCTKKSDRLLVYEYMQNGSLDKWVFGENDTPILDWKTRQKVILGTAKGLCYLHEECRQRIVHLVIKPENILLDGNFNAKLSDFGLSKLIDRDESHVMTTMRGTPGYLAPEWLSAAISEKADVYSFGIVMVEVVCGRRNIDLSQPIERKYLLVLLKSIKEDYQLLDFVQMLSSERMIFGEEALHMIKLAMKCLEIDHTKRPSMSTVVKVLEGTVELESCVGSEPLESWVSGQSSEVQSGFATQCGGLLLSGPR